MNMAEMTDKVPKHVRRLSGWWTAVVVAVAIVGIVAHQQIEVLVWKVAQICVGVVLAYLADRTLFRRALDVSEDMPTDIFGGLRLIARAIVALAVIMGITIGI